MKKINSFNPSIIVACLWVLLGTLNSVFIGFFNLDILDFLWERESMIWHSIHILIGMAGLYLLSRYICFTNEERKK